MRRLIVPALMPFLLSVPGLRADELDRPGRVLVGERLDPADCGPGVIEDMDVVLARDRARAAEAADNLEGRQGDRGEWAIPSRGATYYPFSGDHCAVNKWGDPCMAISFPTPVDLHGAYFAGQGGQGAWALGVRVIGYRDSAEVETTDWFRDIGAGAVWFDMNLLGVDRVVIQSIPAINGRGWYAMDDLTYTPVARPDHVRPDTVVVDFEDGRYKQTLSGSGYAGLVWEEGPGEFDAAESIHPPMVPPGYAEPDPDGGDGGSGERSGGHAARSAAGFSRHQEG